VIAFCLLTEPRSHRVCKSGTWSVCVCVSVCVFVCVGGVDVPRGARHAFKTSTWWSPRHSTACCLLLLLLLLRLGQLLLVCVFRNPRSNFGNTEHTSSRKDTLRKGKGELLFSLRTWTPPPSCMDAFQRGDNELFLHPSQGKSFSIRIQSFFYF